MIVRQFLQWVRARAYLYSDLSADDLAAAEGAMIMLLDDASPLVRHAMAEAVGFIDFTGAEAMQQRAQYAAHMCVVVDDEETQTVEIDTSHGAPASGAWSPIPAHEANRASLTKGLA
jgi:hypothetical protein